MHFARLANTLLKDDESERDNHVFDDNFAKYSLIKKITHVYTVSDKPFFIWLLTITPHLI